MIWEYDDFRFVFENPFATMDNNYRLYSPSAVAYASIATVSEHNDFVIRAREVAREEPERSQYEPPAGRGALPFLVSAFKGQNGQVDLYVPYGLPADAGADGDFTTGLFLLDENYAIVAEQRDSVDVGAATPEVDIDSDPFWLHAAHFSAGTGTYNINVEFEAADGMMAGYERQSITLPSFISDAVRVSDVMPALLVEEGEAQGPGLIARNGHTITAVPGGVFERAQPLYLYFEMYNLAQESDGATGYAIEAVLVPQDEDVGGVRKVLRGIFGGGDKTGVSVGFEGNGTTPDEPRYLVMDVSEQPAGRYTLALRVRDTVSGATTEASREIVLR